MNTSGSAGNLFNSIAKNAGRSSTSTLNSTTSALGSALNSAINSTNVALNSAANSFENVANSFTNAATSTMNSFANSVMPNSLMRANWNMNTSTAAASSPGWIRFVAVFLILVGIFAAVAIVFKDQIKAAFDKLGAAIRGEDSVPVKPAPAPVPQPEPKPAPKPVPAEPAPAEQGAATTGQQESKGLLAKLLPMGSDEVFSISTNNYTYYDAEPMCRALGAELATYDQVMDAYKKGADWCNYGWIKGQAAVFPTQKETFDRLQGGPEEERTACGRPGVNGGYFDNPEMRFGVTCYGKKPPQTANDERALMERGTIPKSPALFKADQLAEQYRAQLNQIGILPFNSAKWSV